MRKKRLLNQLFLSYVWITVAAVVLVGFYGSRMVHDFYLNQTAEDLEARARLCSREILALLDEGKTAEVDALCKEQGRASNTRITVILLPSGKVVGDTKEDPEVMDPHDKRPEVLQARDGSVGRVEERLSSTLRIDMMYIAVPVHRGGEVPVSNGVEPELVVRTSIPVTAIDETLGAMRQRIVIAAVLTAAAIVAVSLWIAARLSTPLKEVKDGAERFALGDFDHRLATSSFEEIAALADAMNRMAEQLDERFQTIVRLENIRRDFVANVSHELRTPITSIKGFVETLLDGAWNDRQNADRFLEIVLRQVNRLDAIINDLLTLSRVEKGDEWPVSRLEPGGVHEVLKAAMGMCEKKAADKGVQIELDCPADVVAEVNAPLLEQAVVNLVDNAIKYSESGQSIHVSGERLEEEKGIIIHVRDEGCGIDSRHLPRLFERFYRVDKARSRELGGTGLGLAIVKHITLAHGGVVEVQSIVGEGSTFSIRLPVAHRNPLADRPSE